MLYLRCFIRFILFSLALSGLSVSSVNAAIVDNFFYTTDTISGLDWLDLTVTTNISLADVQNQLGPGGAFEGWQVADSSMVSTFWDNAGGGGNYTGNQFVPQAWIRTLTSLWGTTRSTIDADFSYAFTTDVHQDGRLNVDILQDNKRSFAADNAYAFPTSGRVAPGPNPFIGTALYRTSEIPVPAAAWLFGTALVGLLGFSRRRKAA